MNDDCREMAELLTIELPIFMSVQFCKSLSLGLTSQVVEYMTYCRHIVSLLTNSAVVDLSRFKDSG